MQELKIISLPKITLIGKEGLCSRDDQLAPRLWEEANVHFPEIAHLGLKNTDGTYVGFWGAMSDESRHYLPWTEDFSRGLYLAGLQVAEEAEPPEGWAKWILPARTWLATAIQPEGYTDTFSHVIGTVLPERQLSLCGAVCEQNDPSTGKWSLLFPVTEEQPGISAGDERNDP